ncbi:MAG: aminoacyl-tRNA hydrolase [Ignavibacteriales bacterium CG_4_9_14_3_um_filter_30_11]|nr:MAG: aminoacyl-tRNA hydrolase [Ignavibacteriales bacterium CG12_big_fil_rev_8_21_14_0_65_30_8]PJA99955.1 MAG: aminoacyl-tRNA hydrolase [Ignavibacteriales bacterium CG_4_9_14_3_um_filter_30_11]
MRIILGIGNPEQRYKNNRHNIGFMLLDYFADKHSLKFKASKQEYYFCKGNISGEKYTLVKPTTYVNNSGIAAKQLLDKLKTPVNELLVICDDINLDIPVFRIRVSGGDGGHNGLSSIIYHLNDNNFARLRLGIGNDFENGSMAEYVLSDFKKDETEKLKYTFEKSIILLEEFIVGGYKQMLNVNSRINKNLIN